MRAFLLLAGLLVLCGAVASNVRADGLPVLGSEAGAGGVPTSNGFRYITMGAGGRTVVARIGTQQGAVDSRFLPGRFTVPVVAYNGSTGGLSADGKTLVLIQPRAGFPQARTRFAVLDARPLRVRKIVTLRGDFSFDAISPGGSTLYFIQYLSADDPTQYAVRAFDARAGKLLREPIVDRTEPDEKMGGNPLSRATSPDGRWAYTLYDGAGMAPFVHALDTVGRGAHCIDLDALAGRTDLFDLRLRLDGVTLAVVKGTQRLAVVDTRTLRVVEPSVKPRPSSGGSPWLPIAVVSLLAAAALSFLLLRRRRLAPT